MDLSPETKKRMKEENMRERALLRIKQKTERIQLKLFDRNSKLQSENLISLSNEDDQKQRKHSF